MVDRFAARQGGVAWRQPGVGKGPATYPVLVDHGWSRARQMSPLTRDFSSNSIEVLSSITGVSSRPRAEGGFKDCMTPSIIEKYPTQY